MTPQDKPDNSNAKYYPPAHDVLVHFAQNLGNELGGEFAEWEVVHGLADFMTVIAEVLANDLNRKHGEPFDNGIE